MVYSATLRTIRSFLLLLIVGVAATANSSAQEGKKYAHEFYHDFRGKPLSKDLHIVGNPEDGFIKEETEGLRITLPKTWIHPWGGVACRTNFSIQGDFEITGAYEILLAEEPTQGFGVGPSLRVQLADPHAEGATLARLARAGGIQTLAWDRIPEKGGGKIVGGVQSCADKLLRLRLTRSGKSLHYAWAPGLVGDRFIEIKELKDFGDRDIVAVRMNVVTGRQPCNVDVRFLDLRIRSGGLIDANAKAAPAAVPVANQLQANPAGASPRSGSSLILALALGLGLTVLLMLAFAAFFFLKRKSASTEHAVADAAAEPEYVCFVCPACGKKLKAKTASIGKKIKCGKCGEATLVPDAEA